MSMFKDLLTPYRKGDNFTQSMRSCSVTLLVLQALILDSSGQEEYAGALVEANLANLTGKLVPPFNGYAKGGIVEVSETTLHGCVGCHFLSLKCNQQNKIYR